ncbi:hypothetical protein PLESTM_001669100 [Pleodorina starrii]|nr:hypothetical protein PLESTM_001669100 [Pleodorina starrii]
MCTTTSGTIASTNVSHPGAMTFQRGSVVELRQELRDLDAQRRAIEEEVSLLLERLNAPGQPGIKGSLLDKQGFPRADIDVVQVRRDRHRLICLTNDQKALTDKLAKLLAELHEAVRSSQRNGAAGTSASDVAPAPEAPAAPAAAAAGSGGANATSGEPVGNGAAAMDVDGDADASRGAAAGNGTAAGTALVPFALIDEVSGGSPAEAAGLQVGDLLCAFGDVSAAVAGQGGGLLQRVASVLSASEGRPVAARVLRQGTPLELSLTPARWPGRGLLGCHLRPL